MHPNPQFKRNFYHAYLASLGLRFEDIPATERIFPEIAHIQWMNVGTKRIQLLFHQQPWPRPERNEYHQMVWDAATQKVPAMLTLQLYWNHRMKANRVSPTLDSTRKEQYSDES